jgi:hypothetical protein
MEFSQKDIERFWSKVNIKGEDECWNWTASLHRSGYGHYKIKNEVKGPHQCALWLACCPQIENKTHALHTCKQNRICCNPKHLYWGDNQDNMNDKINDETGYCAKGILHPMVKLTEEQVLEIRQKYKPRIYTYKMLADEYGLSGKSVVCSIVNRQSWKHI